MTQTKTFKRRQFLRIIGASSVAGLAAFMLDRADRPQNSLEVVTETRLLMGTVVNLTLVTSDRQAGQAAIQTCLQQMVALEAILSRYQPSSQLSCLNRNGFLKAANPHLLNVERAAQQISELTGGAFDVTVKPLVDLYQNCLGTERRLPPASSLASALQLVGFRNLYVEESEVWFSKKGMGVTLDGIAKGYVVDQGLAILRQQGFSNVMVEAGGDLSVAGTKAPDTLWRIGIQAPRDTGATLLHTFSITNQAVATSGDYRQSYTDDFAVYHIFDPRTGRCAPKLASATVVAETGVIADALATALMVMGPEQGLSLIESIPSCEAYLIGKHLEIWHSSGFPV